MKTHNVLLYAAAIFMMSTGYDVMAQNMSDQDINLMMGSSKAIDSYKKGGITGVVIESDNCYKKIKTSIVNQQQIEFCIAMDLGGFFIDYSMTQLNNFPRTEYFTDQEAFNRIDEILKRTGISKNSQDTQSYINSRNPKVQRFTNLSMQTN